MQLTFSLISTQFMHFIVLRADLFAFFSTSQTRPSRELFVVVAVHVLHRKSRAQAKQQNASRT